MALDLAVSREITKLRALERAVHDPGPWSICVRGLFLAPERVVLPDCVRFTVTISAHDGAVPTLFCRDEWVYTFSPISSFAVERRHAFELALNSRIAA